MKLNIEAINLSLIEGELIQGAFVHPQKIFVFTTLGRVFESTTIEPLDFVEHEKGLWG